MSQSTTHASFSPPWFLIVGLLAGIAFVAYIVWDTSGPPVKKGGSSSHVFEFTQANWQKEVVDSKVPVLVDFTASWCPPCRAFAPTLDRLAERYQGKVKIGKLDVGDQGFNKARKLAEQYQIRGIPHVMLFTGGDRPRMEFPGAGSEEELAKEIDSVLASR